MGEWISDNSKIIQVDKNSIDTGVGYHIFKRKKFSKNNYFYQSKDKKNKLNKIR